MTIEPGTRYDFSVLDLHAVDRQRPGMAIPDAALSSDRFFVGDSERQANGRVYGGQVLAQCVVAASRTVDADRLVHSLHAYFLRPGDFTRPILFGVERLRDGRSFSARRVHAYQDGATILSMIASFQLAQSGVEHQEPMPDVPEPETLAQDGEIIAAQATAGAELRTRYWVDQRPLDVRHVGTPVYFDGYTDRRPRQAVWMRSLTPLGDDPVVHRAVFAYASDMTLLEPAMLRHGVAWTTPGLRMASLDHAMWWHREARADEWFLYVADSPSAENDRALCDGRIFDRAGRLVASTAQQGMFRVPRD